jgi:hypothetical protein
MKFSVFMSQQELWLFGTVLTGLTPSLRCGPVVSELNMGTDAIFPL